MNLYRAESIDELSESATLAALFGPVTSVERTPLETIGFTGARHEQWRVSLRSGEHVRLVAKRVRPSQDWICCRTGDTLGREANLLGEPSLNAVWEVFERPYLAFAASAGEALLLMHDLSPHLVPDTREPVTRSQEERLITALATLHARYWASPMLNLPWLTTPRILGGLLDARVVDDRKTRSCRSRCARTSIAGGVRRCSVSRAVLRERFPLQQMT